jgi:Fur family ferric uptake transcriptional regulator
LEIQKSLSTAGYRLTRPRQAVIEVIARARRSLSPAEVLSRARKRDPRIGLATVYRTLEMLQREGFLNRVGIGNQGYVLMCIEQGLHFHLVCERCRAVTELRASRSLVHRLRRSGFISHRNAIEIVGICARCQRKTPLEGD